MKKRLLALLTVCCMAVLVGCGSSVSLNELKEKTNEALVLAQGYQDVVESEGYVDVIAEYNEAMLGIEAILEQLEKGSVKSADYEQLYQEIIGYETTINNIGVNVQGRQQ